MAHLYLCENPNPQPGEARVALMCSDSDRPPNDGLPWQRLDEVADSTVKRLDDPGPTGPWAPMAPMAPGAGDLAPDAVDESALFRDLAAYLHAAPEHGGRLASYLATLTRQRDRQVEQAAAQASEPRGRLAGDLLDGRNPQGALAQLAKIKVEQHGMTLADAYREASREHPSLYERARAASYLAERPGLETRLLDRRV